MSILSLNISTSVLSFEVSSLISLDRISTLVLSFPGICHNRKLYSCSIRYHLACRAFSFCVSRKYFRFSWSVHILNCSFALSRYCRHVHSALIIVSNSLL
jgi:hypothetical protein